MFVYKHIFTLTNKNNCKNGKFIKQLKTIANQFTAIYTDTYDSLQIPVYEI